MRNRPPSGSTQDSPSTSGVRSAGGRPVSAVRSPRVVARGRGDVGRRAHRQPACPNTAGDQCQRGRRGAGGAFPVRCVAIPGRRTVPLGTLAVGCSCSGVRGCSRAWRLTWRPGSGLGGGLRVGGVAGSALQGGGQRRRLRQHLAATGSCPGCRHGSALYRDGCVQRGCLACGSSVVHRAARPVGAANQRSSPGARLPIHWGRAGLFPDAVLGLCPAYPCWLRPARAQHADGCRHRARHSGPRQCHCTWCFGRMGGHTTPADSIPRAGPGH